MFLAPEDLLPVPGPRLCWSSPSRDSRRAPIAEGAAMGPGAHASSRRGWRWAWGPCGRFWGCANREGCAPLGSDPSGGGLGHRRVCPGSCLGLVTLAKSLGLPEPVCPRDLQGCGWSLLSRWSRGLEVRRNPGSSVWHSRTYHAVSHGRSSVIPASTCSMVPMCGADHHHVWERCSRVYTGLSGPWETGAGECMSCPGCDFTQVTNH